MNFKRATYAVPVMLALAFGALQFAVPPTAGAANLSTVANPTSDLTPPSFDWMVATNDARAQEGLGAMPVSEAALATVAVPEQVFILENLERIGRGLPPIDGMNTELEADAQIGANEHADPPVTNANGWTESSEIWSAAPSPLSANYDWMYDDGWDGSLTSNDTCTSPSSTGCWDHRQIILEDWTCPNGQAPVTEMGAATAGSSIAVVFAEFCGSFPPGQSTTWAQAQAQMASYVPNVVQIVPTRWGGGYWEVSSNGTVAGFGVAPDYGSMGGQPLNAPIVGMATTADGTGYWLEASDGGIFAFGGATFYGSMGGQPLNSPIVGIVSTQDNHGYWEIAADGGVFAFGDATFYGSMGGQPLNAPIVGMATTADGHGYWLVASDGGIFAYGDAAFHGSMGGHQLDQPIVGMAPDWATGGYWELARDGGVFTFNAPFEGSVGGMSLDAPVVSIGALSWTGNGYWMAASDGGVFTFGSAVFYGSEAA